MVVTKLRTYHDEIAVGFCMRNEFLEKLSGGDLRSIGNVDFIVDEIQSQNDFDELFACLSSDDRLIVMRTADAVEKITIKHIDYLGSHKEEVLAFCKHADSIEFKWHLALLLPRLSLSENEYACVFHTLSSWLLDSKESKIVRVNSMQALYEFSKQDLIAKEKLDNMMNEVEKENLPSLLARIRKIKRRWSGLCK